MKEYRQIKQLIEGRDINMKNNKINKLWINNSEYLQVGEIISVEIEEIWYNGLIARSKGGKLGFIDVSTLPIFSTRIHTFDYYKIGQILEVTIVFFNNNFSDDNYQDIVMNLSVSDKYNYIKEFWDVVKVKYPLKTTLHCKKSFLTAVNDEISISFHADIINKYWGTLKISDINLELKDEFFCNKSTIDFSGEIIEYNDRTKRIYVRALSLIEV